MDEPSATTLTFVLAVATSTAAIATAYAAFQTRKLVVESKKLRQQQAEPEVVVYVRSDPGAKVQLQLVIENIGSGVAKNVRIRPPGTFELPRGKPDDPLPGPFAHEIPLLPPGGQRVVIWGMSFDLVNNVRGERFEFEAEYVDRFGNHLGHTSTVEIDSFLATDISENEPAFKIAKHLDGIAKATAKIAEKLN